MPSRVRGGRLSVWLCVALSMSSPGTLFLLVAGGTAVAGAARRYRLSAPLLLVVADA